MPTKPPLAVSSWSLHRALGLTYPNRPELDITPKAEPAYGAGRIDLLAMPAEIARLGIGRAEISSSHVPTRDAAYLDELRMSLREAGVTLQTPLIEYGDLTDPAVAERDIAWMQGWIDAAGALGAEKARVIAGKARPGTDTDTDTDTLDRSAAALLRLARHGKAAGVQIVTENWFALLPDADTVLDLFDRLDGSVALNGDFGNCSGDNKMPSWSGSSGWPSAATPRAISPRARSTRRTIGAAWMPLRRPASPAPTR